MKLMLITVMLSMCSFCLADGASPKRQARERDRVNNLIDHQAADQAAARDAVRKKAEVTRMEAEAKLSPEEKAKLQTTREVVAKKAAVKARALKIRSQLYK